MYCSQCGTQLPTSANYCMKCGTAAARPPAEERLPFGMPDPSESPSFTPSWAPSQPVQPVQPMQVQQEDAAIEEQPFYQPNQPRKFNKGTIGLAVIALVIIAGGLIYYWSGNSEVSQATPEKTVKSYMKVLQKGDARTLLSLRSPELVPEDTEDLEEMVATLESFMKRFKLIEYTIGKAEIDEDEATVEVTMKFSIEENGNKLDEYDQDFDVELVRMKGKWYIRN